MIHIKTTYPKLSGQRWRACRLCGPSYSHAEIMFVTGSVEPVVGEVLTGGTSAHYGTVVSVELESGSWAAGTADGRVELSGVSGFNEDRECFADGETITGSTAAALVADEPGWEQVYGILHPENEMTKAEDGYWYCSPHYESKFGGAAIDAAKIDVNERGRTIP